MKCVPAPLSATKSARPPSTGTANKPPVVIRLDSKKSLPASAAQASGTSARTSDVRRCAFPDAVSSLLQLCHHDVVLAALAEKRQAPPVHGGVRSLGGFGEVREPRRFAFEGRGGSIDRHLPQVRGVGVGSVLTASDHQSVVSGPEERQNAAPALEQKESSSTSLRVPTVGSMASITMSERARLPKSRPGASGRRATKRSPKPNLLRRGRARCVDSPHQIPRR